MIKSLDWIKKFKNYVAEEFQILMVTKDGYKIMNQNFMLKIMLGGAKTDFMNRDKHPTRQWKYALVCR